MPPRLRKQGAETHPPRNIFRIAIRHQMESLHRCARELPRLTQWAEIAAVIDELVMAALNTDRLSADLLRRAQENWERRRL